MNRSVSAPSEKLKTLLSLISHRSIFCIIVLPLIMNTSIANADSTLMASGSMNTDKKTSNQRMNIIDSFTLESKTKRSLPFSELSDLAWDADEELLYAISDEGTLYHLKLNSKNKQLQSIDIVATTSLKDEYNQALEGKFCDSEGLTLLNGNNGRKGDSKLVVSFENKPRIAEYLTNGRFSKTVQTKEKFRKRKTYRSKNKALESIVLHPKHGILTAAEQPMISKSMSQQSLYSPNGKEWNFASSKVQNSSITALEVLPNDNILILERAYDERKTPTVVSLRELSLNKCDKSNFCETKVIAELDSSKGWILDNFEGLTYFRDNQYLMVSDNNDDPSNNTTLVLFELGE